MSITPTPPASGPPTATRRPGMLGTLAMFAELVKFEHSIFALPYAYIGALYGAAAAVRALQPAGTAGVVVYLTGDRWITPEGWPTWAALLWITVAMVGARAFAFAVNRAVDREIDARNPRTAGRAVPAGLVKAWELWAFAAVMLAGFLLAVWQLHPVCRLLWPVPLAAFVAYPYLKRFTWLCHWWLGLCLGLAPVAAWTAVTGNALAVPAYAFGLAVLVWTAGFDIIYATQDVECDRRDGLHSLPADFGLEDALAIGKLMHVFTIFLLALAGTLVFAGWEYYLLLAVAAGLLTYENLIVRPDDLSRVDAAFFTVNGVIAVVVLAGVLLDRVVG